MTAGGQRHEADEGRRVDQGPDAHGKQLHVRLQRVGHRHRLVRLDVREPVGYHDCDVDPVGRVAVGGVEKDGVCDAQPSRGVRLSTCREETKELHTNL